MIEYQTCVEHGMVWSCIIKRNCIEKPCWITEFFHKNVGYCVVQLDGHVLLSQQNSVELSRSYSVALSSREKFGRPRLISLRQTARAGNHLPCGYVGVGTENRITRKFVRALVVQIVPGIQAIDPTEKCPRWKRTTGSCG